MLLGYLRSLLRWSILLCIPGGALWALSPLGVSLSEYRYSTPAVFWKLFPSAVLLMLVGVVGLWLWTRSPGWLEGTSVALLVLGALLIVAGDVGKYWLGVDDYYLMTAPAYKAFRLGLVVLTLGSLLFGTFSARNRSLPAWVALPFAISSLAGLISVLQDFGYFGAGMWILFGVGWVWMGLALPFASAVSSWGKRRVR